MKEKLLRMAKIIFIFTLLINIFLVNTNICVALSDVTSDPNSWYPTEDVGEKKLNYKSQVFLTLIRTLGVIVSVLSLAIIAVKIMLGSVEEKAQYKQMLVPWAIGAFLVISMTTLPGIIYDIVRSDSEPIESSVTTKEKIQEYYCIRGYKLEYVPSSSGHVHTYSNCDCGATGGHTGYGCPDCHVELYKKSNGYYVCRICGMVYE